MHNWWYWLCLVSDTFTKRHLYSVTHKHQSDCRAREFARQGCIVYATSRRVETITDFEDPGIHKLALDVTSDENIKNVVREVIDKEGKLDIVVNNAGIICPGSYPNT